MMLKRWFTVIIIGTLGRFFNNPQIVYRLEDKLANSGVIRQLARTIVALMQRGSWEFKQLKSSAQKELGQRSVSDAEAEFLKKFKQFQDEVKRRSNGKF